MHDQVSLYSLVKSRHPLFWFGWFSFFSVGFHLHLDITYYLPEVYFYIYFKVVICMYVGALESVYINS